MGGFIFPSSGGAVGPPGPAGPAGPAGAPGAGVLGLATYIPTADYNSVGPVAYPVTTTNPYRVFTWSSHVGAATPFYSAGDNYPDVSSELGGLPASGALPYASPTHSFSGTPGPAVPFQYSWYAAVPVPQGATGFSSLTWYQFGLVGVGGAATLRLDVGNPGSVDPVASATRGIVTPGDVVPGSLALGASGPLFPTPFGRYITVGYGIQGTVNGVLISCQAAAFEIVWT